MTEYTETGNQLTDIAKAGADVNVHFGNIEASYEPDTLNLLSLSFGGYYYDFTADGTANTVMRNGANTLYSYDRLYNIPGNVPNPVNMPNYCYFRDRCEKHCDKCAGDYPPEIRISDTHVVSCWRYEGEGEILGYPKSVKVEEL